MVPLTPPSVFSTSLLFDILGGGVRPRDGRPAAAADARPWISACCSCRARASSSASEPPPVAPPLPHSRGAILQIIFNQ